MGAGDRPAGGDVPTREGATVSEEVKDPRIDLLERRVERLEAAMTDVLDLLDASVEVTVVVDPLQAAQEAFLARIRTRWKGTEAGGMK